MIGIVCVTHGTLASQMIETARLIGLDSDEAVATLSLPEDGSQDMLRDQIAQAIKTVNRGQGVLILTDLFGGSPTNLSLTFLKEGWVEVVTGLNLPMILKAFGARNEADLKTLARLSAEAGRESIFDAGDVMRQRAARRKGAEAAN